MIYDYKCPVCEQIFNIEMPMSEVGNLTESTKNKLKCPGFGKCEYINEDEQNLAEEIVFQREYSSIGMLKFDGLPMKEKQQVLKKRASADFKKNIEEKKRHLQGTAMSQLKSLVKK